MKHDCLDYMVPLSHEWTEPHGEVCYQRWWLCPECEKNYSETEAAQMCIERAEAELAIPSKADSKLLSTKDG